MKIVDILELEQSNQSKVILLKEWVFRLVYERSAMQFVTNKKNSKIKINAISINLRNENHIEKKSKIKVKNRITKT